MNGEHLDSGECRKCGETALPGPEQGLDPCLGLLPGVSAACCGHGETEAAYVVIGGGPGQESRQIENGVTLQGEEAQAYFDLVAGADERWDRENPWRPLVVVDGQELEVRVVGGGAVAVAVEQSGKKRASGSRGRAS